MVAFDLDPGAAGDDRRVRRGGAAAARGLRAPRAGGVPEDVGLEGHAGLRAAQHAGDLRRDEARSPRAIAAAARAARPRARGLGDEQGQRARARSSSTGARTTSTRRPSPSTRCARWTQPTVSTPLTWEEVEDAAGARDPDDLVFTRRRGARAGGRARRPLRAGGSSSSRSCPTRYNGAMDLEERTLEDTLERTCAVCGAPADGAGDRGRPRAGRPVPVQRPCRRGAPGRRHRGRGAD